MKKYIIVILVVILLSACDYFDRRVFEIKKVKKNFTLIIKNIPIHEELILLGNAIHGMGSSWSDEYLVLPENIYEGQAEISFSSLPVQILRYVVGESNEAAEQYLQIKIVSNVDGSESNQLLIDDNMLFIKDDDTGIEYPIEAVKIIEEEVGGIIIARTFQWIFVYDLDPEENPIFNSTKTELRELTITPLGVPENTSCRFYASSSGYENYINYQIQTKYPLTGLYCLQVYQANWTDIDSIQVEILNTEIILSPQIVNEIIDGEIVERKTFIFNVEELINR
jgi:hypothetical protein